MPNDLMLRCEQRREYITNGKHEWRWKEVPASELEPGAKGIRCMHCHGAIRVHHQSVPHGPQDHVEHLSRQDSAGCKGGVHFDGSHRRSLQPVE